MELLFILKMFLTLGGCGRRREGKWRLPDLHDRAPGTAELMAELLLKSRMS